MLNKKRFLIASVLLSAFIAGCGGSSKSTAPPTITCDDGEQLVNGQCIVIPPICDDDQELIDGQCKAVPIECEDDEVVVNGECKPKPIECEEGKHLEGDLCVITCAEDEVLVNGACLATASNDMLVDNTTPDTADPTTVISNTQAGPILDTNVTENMAPDYQQTLSTNKPE